MTVLYDSRGYEVPNKTKITIYNELETNNHGLLQDTNFTE
jgi:hypothetical protein